MKITRIKILKLFGELEHTIQLSDEGITFVHGPNGCGKTTILNMVAAFLSGNYQFLLDTDFESMETSFSDESMVVVKKVPWNGAIAPRPDEDVEDGDDEDHDIEVSLERNKILENGFSFRDHQKKVASFPRVSVYVIERRITGVRRVGPNLWREAGSTRAVSTRDLIEKHSELLGVEVESRQPIWLKKHLDRCKVGYVRTQRLVRNSRVNSRSFRGEESEEPVEEILASSAALQARIEKQLADSAIHAQMLDRTFPQRLIRTGSSKAKPLPEHEIRETYKRTQQASQALMSTGLFEQAENVPLPVGKLKPTERRVLSLYLGDLEAKLSAYGDLQKRIETFLEIVGSKFRRKKLSIERTNGFVITALANNTDLPLTALSSGEQHQIILFFELLFSVDKKDVYFIDEPEISLHVEWQRRFFSDIEKVKKLTGADFLIATHSPQIINARTDLAVALDGGIHL